MHRLLLVLLIAIPAFGKSLHWRSVDVQARLDAEGRLHVVERQQMVFDGDWNGGERKFRLPSTQRLDVNGVSRVENGREVALQQGNLAEVDHYDVVDDGALRWRSRLPSDPPFENTEITYVLRFTYDRILQADGDGLVLSHDFGFADRDGVIELFTLKLEFDPVWKTAPIEIARANVLPGQGVEVQRFLTPVAGRWPEGVARPLPAWTGPAALLAFLGAMAALIAAFVAGERKTGRFARVQPMLDAELMKLKPEVLGAMWDAGVDPNNTDLSDGGVGPAEVSAVLARMTQEGKIATRVEGKELHMRLLVPRSDLTGYERRLVAEMFFEDEVTTKTLKKHYKGTGFDPAKTIRPGIVTAICDAFPRWKAKIKTVPVKTHVFTLVGLGALLVALAVFGDGEDVGEILVIGVVGVIFGVLACSVAWSRSRAITNFGRAFAVPALLMMIPSALLALGALRALPGGRLSPLAYIACALWVLAIARLALDLMKIGDVPEVIAIRKRVVAIRSFFRQQLRLPQPALRDEWFPYLLAFGLGKHADRWFRAFGPTASTSHTSASSWSSGSSGATSSSSWTGGGGAFGGAGATASWAVAAGAIASGVSAPGSSGGGGGGGSSSGGGGGGGW